MKWRNVSGFAGDTHFSNDGQWTIHNVQTGVYRLSRKRQVVGDFSTLRLAKKAAEQATDE
jgi:hypothetical protein